MIYCTNCSTEALPGATACASCQARELVSAEEMKRRGLLLPNEKDTRRFLRAGTTEDPLSAEKLVAVLTEVKIPVFVRPRRSGSVDALTSGTALPWWEILVPEEFCDRASALITEELAREEADADEASRAAEAEELETEALAAGNATGTGTPNRVV